MTQGGTKAKPWSNQMSTTTRPWACLGHLDGTLTRTHGFHDMCDVHPVAATARDLVRPTFSLCYHEGT